MTITTMNPTAHLSPALDPTTIAAANGVPYAELNGPRFWLMNSIAKVRTGGQVVKTSGASP